MEERVPVVFEFYYARLDTWWENNFYPATDGLAVFATNITERKRAEALRSRLAAIVDSSDDAIFSKSLDGTILSWNQGAQKLYGYSPEEAIGQEVSLLFPPHAGNETQEIMEHIRRGELIKHHETIRVKKAGTPVEVSVTISPIRDASGRIVGGSSIGHDIGERKQMEAQQKQLYKKVQMQERQLRDLASYLQTARENERTSLARQVHDELGQSLTALKMDLSWLTKRIPGEQPALRAKAKAMSELIDQTVIRVRQIATQLRPGLLDHLGLVAAMEWQTQEFSERTDIFCELEIREKELLIEDEAATQLFRVFQEALTNVARHAQASRVKIKMFNERGMIILQIEDNGQGIQKNKVTSSKSLGLVGMRERIWALGGQFKIQGIKGKGTRLEVNIPQQNSKEKNVF
jgi:PAS domain S-box-containing protein